MPTPDDIEQQQELLATYRRTLAHLLKQAAKYGGEVFAPPQTVNGIAEARAYIRSIKGILREWGLEVENHGDDDEISYVPQQRQDTNTPNTIEPLPVNRGMTVFATRENVGKASGTAATSSAVKGDMTKALLEILDNVRSKEEIHRFLEENDDLLKGRTYDWVLVNLPLGSDYFIDFVIAYTMSDGLHMVAINLVNPLSEQVFSSDGKPIQDLSDAISLITHWSYWIENNKTLFLKTFRKYFKQKYAKDWETNAKHRFYKLSRIGFEIIAGRRGAIESSFAAAQKLIYQSMTQNMTISSYDRLIESYDRAWHLKRN